MEPRACMPGKWKVGAGMYALDLRLLEFVPHLTFTFDKDGKVLSGSEDMSGNLVPSAELSEMIKWERFTQVKKYKLQKSAAAKQKFAVKVETALQDCENLRLQQQEHTKIIEGLCLRVNVLNNNVDVLNNSVDKLNNKIDQNTAVVHQRVSRLESYMETRCDEVHKRINRLEMSMGERCDQLHNDLRGLRIGAFRDTFASAEIVDTYLQQF